MVLEKGQEKQHMSMVASMMGSGRMIRNMGMGNINT